MRKELDHVKHQLKLELEARFEIKKVDFVTSEETQKSESDDLSNLSEIE
jgi:hypothetical protein